MEKLVDEGLVKSIGISNFSVPKTKDLQSYARIQPAVNQVEIHPYWRNDKLWEYATSSKVTATPDPSLFNMLGMSLAPHSVPHAPQVFDVVHTYPLNFA